MFKPTSIPIRYGVSPAEYHAYGTEFKRGDARYVMSRGELMAFAHCPRKWLLGVEDEEKTPALDWGSLIDCLVLTPERFDIDYAVCPETYPSKKEGDKEWNWNANFCKDWRAEQKANGKEVVKASTLEAAKTAVGRIFADEILADFINGSKKQAMVVAEWDDGNYIIPFKILVDLVPSGRYSDALGDLKTAESLSPKAWDRQIATYHYHVQAAMYLDVWNAATGENRTEFRHPASESSPPYEPGRRWLTKLSIDSGRMDYEMALMEYRDCLKTGIFPGYDERREEGSEIIDGWRLANLPAWAI